MCTRTRNEDECPCDKHASVMAAGSMTEHNVNVNIILLLLQRQPGAPGCSNSYMRCGLLFSTSVQGSIDVSTSSSHCFFKHQFSRSCMHVHHTGHCCGKGIEIITIGCELSPRNGSGALHCLAHGGRLNVITAYTDVQRPLHIISLQQRMANVSMCV